MALYCTRNIASVAVAAATSLVIWMQLLLILLSDAASSGAAHIDECPTGLVYPYWSRCWDPATYEEVYEFESASRATLGSRLAPEWDEANSTYYVRLADVGAKYAFTYLTLEIRPAVALSNDVIIYNVDTGRTLGWRQEGEDEWFLVEAGGDRFQFSKAENVDVVLPCPLIWGARCEVYSILSLNNNSLGLSPYEEDGATYFKLSSADHFPFLLRRSTTTTTTTTSSSSGAVGRRIHMPTAA